MTDLATPEPLQAGKLGRYIHGSGAHIFTHQRMGITATRGQPNDYQIITYKRLLAVLLPSAIHHGDCVGGDAMAHHHAAIWDGVIAIEVWPPERDTLRAFCTGTVMHDPAPYPVRNQSIVDATHYLVAIPAQEENVSQRSGTWMTVNMAREAKKPRVIIYRDRIEVEK